MRCVKSKNISQTHHRFLQNRTFAFFKKIIFDTVLLIFYLSMFASIFAAIVSTNNDSSAYLPIVLQFLIVASVIVVIIIGTHFLGPKRSTKKKLENFECGIAEEGNARQPLAIKYFLVAILFVLFDVEVVFFYPYAVNFKTLQWQGLGAIGMFVGIFLIGYYYIIRKNALQWED